MGSNGMAREPKLTARRLLDAYASGYFPMAESRDNPELYWFNPPRRGVLPLDDFHVPSSLKKVLRRQPFELRVNTAFEAVIRACAELNHSRKETWINDVIIGLYCELHAKGHAHSVESWQDGKLVGGLYGVSLGGAFFGESMFSRTSEASKVALVHLVERLRAAGYRLLDTQFVNEHLKQFGVKEITKRTYMARLDKALRVEPNPSSLFSTVAVRSGAASSSSSSTTSGSSDDVSTRCKRA